MEQQASGEESIRSYSWTTLLPTDFVGFCDILAFGHPGPGTYSP